MERLPPEEQFAKLDKVWELLSQANRILCSEGMGSIEYDAGPGLRRTFIYPLADLRQQIRNSLNAVNRIRCDVKEYVLQSDEQR